VTLLRVIPRPEFVQWGGVQSALEEEGRAAARLLLTSAADEVEMLSGARPDCEWKEGESSTAAVLTAVYEDPAIRALVLAAAPKGAPGPLVSFFTGERAGALPCLVIVVPGALDSTAIDRLT